MDNWDYEQHEIIVNGKRITIKGKGGKPIKKVIVTFPNEPIELSTDDFKKIASAFYTALFQVIQWESQFKPNRDESRT